MRKRYGWVYEKDAVKFSSIFLPKKDSRPRAAKSRAFLDASYRKGDEGDVGDRGDRKRIVMPTGGTLPFKCVHFTHEPDVKAFRPIRVADRLLAAGP